ncbi:MAG: PKD domain-containing protein [Dehalococcoidia bacterium]|nr:PKD domain-containing protein [Dehalococcoidia bacterium]
MAWQGSNDKIAELLKQAYPPAAASPEFKANLRLQVNQQAAALGAATPKPLWQQPFVWIPSAAAAAVAVAVILFFVVFQSVPPTVITGEATGIQTTAATLTGKLDSLGSDDSAMVSFEWGVTAEYGNETTPELRKITGSFEAKLSDLAPNTTYHFRIKAVGSSGTAYGPDMQFTTGPTPPAVTTNDAVQIKTTSAILMGSLDEMGSAASVNVSFEWGLTPSYGDETAPESMSATGEYSADLSGLAPGTTYYFRAKADGYGDTVYGSESRFATMTMPPTVATVDAGNVATTSATLNGNLMSLGTAGSVTVSFEWGTASGSYTNATADHVRTGAGFFYADLSGLAPGVKYYYRAIADGDGEPVYGEEKSFTTTPNLPPVAEAGGPYDVNEGSCIALAGSGSDPEGGALTYAWDLDDDGIFETVGATPLFCGVDGPATVTITLQVCDEFGLCATGTATVTIANVPPAVGAITAPIDPVPVNTAVDASASFTDPGILDTHSAVWEWGDGGTSVGLLDETGGSGSVTGSHTYTMAGKYTVKLTVTDKDGDKGSVTVVITVVRETVREIVSCDSEGNPMEQFAAGQSVYVKGTGLQPNTYYRIWIQHDPVTEGKVLVASEDPSGDGDAAREEVTTDGNGDFGPVEIWAIPADASISYYEYDIVVDKQKDDNNTGVFNSASDGIDSLAAVGFVAPVPELTTLILLGTGFSLLGGWLVLRKRRVAAE